MNNAIYIHLYKFGIRLDKYLYKLNIRRLSFFLFFSLLIIHIMMGQGQIFFISSLFFFQVSFIIKTRVLTSPLIFYSTNNLQNNKLYFLNKSTKSDICRIHTNIGISRCATG